MWWTVPWYAVRMTFAVEERGRKVTIAEMKFTASKGFTDDMAKIVLFCIENKTNCIGIEFTLNDGKKAIVEMTIKAEDGEQHDGLH